MLSIESYKTNDYIWEIKCIFIFATISSYIAKIPLTADETSFTGEQPHVMFGSYGSNIQHKVFSRISP